MDFTLMIFKLIVSMIVIFALMIILFKYANKGINGNLNKKYVKVIERVQISKDGYILVVKVGNKGMVLSTSTGHTEKLQELSEEELAEIEEAKQQALKDMNKKY